MSDSSNSFGGNEPTQDDESHRNPVEPAVSGLGALSEGEYVDIVTVVHGETMNDAFPQWLRICYRGGGDIYTPYDLNMPVTIPRRPVSHNAMDPPLTEHGSSSAEIIGCGLRDHQLIPSTIFSSPELRCVQTASAIARRLNVTYTTVAVEPALADWPMSYDEDPSQYWLQPRQLSYLGYPIDLSYRPFLNRHNFPKNETTQEYIQRLVDFYVHVRKSTPDRLVLIVANAAAEIVSREGKWETPMDLMIEKETSATPCSLHMVRAGNGQLIHRENELLNTFTRCLNDRLQKERRAPSAAH